MGDDVSQDILFEKKGRCGVVTLNRPHALNAVTREMIAALDTHYKAWQADPDIYGVVMCAAGDRAFSAGGDLRSLHSMVQEGRMDDALAYYREEYTRNWQLDRFNKPNIALINGIVMGGGVGVCVYGTHRVAGENLTFAMPEVGIGLFPDIGGAYFLNRFPGETGTYLGLTGKSVGAADAYALGFATHCVRSAHFPQIEAAMREAEPIDPVLQDLHRDPGESSLLARRDWIDTAFSKDSVEAIMAVLGSMTGEARGWAGETLAIMEKKSPLALKVTLRHLRACRGLDLKSVLERDFRLVQHFLNGSDLYEGIRVAIIDKGDQPNWQYRRVEDIPEAAVDAYFTTTTQPDLVLHEAD